jgi:RNA-directed DNA polymerase
MELIEQVLDYRNVHKAYRQVTRNKGVAGVDNISTQELLAYMQGNWDSIKQGITKGQYRPSEVLGVEIPKSNSGKRLLGIPTVIDRLIQQSIHQVLYPMYEIDFSEYSYGFRVGKNAHQAVKQAQSYINQGYQYILDFDLKSFFDIVNHDYLMSLLNRKIKDRLLLKLIRRYLQSGILLNGLSQPREQGTPQGSPLSPLLSNIILNE